MPVPPKPPPGADGGTGKSSRFVALLRAVNVGGRTVKMDALRKLFVDLGFSNVETFIASGNVIFEARKADAQALECEIEAGLKESLGFEVPTFVRTAAELAEVDGHRPFELSENDALYIAFLRSLPTGEIASRIVNLRTEFDEFHVHGREIYWLCRTKISDSKVTGAILERAAGMPATSRNSTTIRKLAAKYPPLSAP